MWIARLVPSKAVELGLANCEDEIGAILVVVVVDVGVVLGMGLGGIGLALALCTLALEPGLELSGVGSEEPPSPSSGVGLVRGLVDDSVGDGVR